MLKTLTLTIAAGALSALLAIDANALPVTPAEQLAPEGNLTLVRDECGRGMRFSRSRQRCVEREDSRDGDRDDRRGDRRSRRDRDDAEEAAGEVIGEIFNAIGNSNRQNSNNNRNRQNNTRTNRNRRQQPGADGQDD